MSQVWTAELRTEEGKGASRRLRHTGQIPAIIYGAGQEAKSIALASNFVERQFMEVDNFNTVLSVDVAGDSENVVVKDVQRHPATGLVTHIDFQRINDTDYIIKRVPFVFEGGEISPGVKMGGLMSFMQQTVEIRCLGKDLPNAITVDVSGMDQGTNIRLSELVLPEGVSIVALSHGNSDYDQAVVGISKVKR